MSKPDDVWDAFKGIADIADKVVGATPQIVACRGCHQKNRVSWAKATVRIPRCGKCGLPLPKP